MILYLIVREITETQGQPGTELKTIITSDQDGREKLAEWQADPNNAALFAGPHTVSVLECRCEEHGACTTRALLETGNKSYLQTSAYDEVLTDLSEIQSDLGMEPDPDITTKTLAEVKTAQKKIVKYEAKVYFDKTESRLEEAQATKAAIRSGATATKWVSHEATLDAIAAAKQTALNAIDAAQTKSAVKDIHFIPPV